jgi:hypothetical protein
MKISEFYLIKQLILKLILKLQLLWFIYLKISILCVHINLKKPPKHNCLRGFIDIKDKVYLLSIQFFALTKASCHGETSSF